MVTPDNRMLLTAALQRTAAGDRVGLQTVYRLTSAKLFGVCCRILIDRGEAEDVLQEIYMTVWRKAGDYDPARASPMTWLIAIARNRAIDRVRSRPAARTLAPLEAAADVADPVPIADDLLEQAQDYARLHACLQALAAHERAALKGAFFEGSNYGELATRMSVPLGTMKSWIRRAILKLKACLAQ